MNPFTFLVETWRCRIGLSSLCILTASAGYCAGAKTGATSKIFVADLQGEAKMENGEKITELVRRSVYSPEGAAIETGKAVGAEEQEKQHSSMVYSNGTGIYFAPGTRLEVRKFAQEPFAPNRTDMDLEPSISDTQTYLARGTVGLCLSKLVAGSRMVYETPHGMVSIRGRRILIEVNDELTRVAVLEGESTARAGKGNGLDMGGQTIQSGEQATIRAGSAGQPAALEISPIPANDRAALEDKVAFACLAKRTVFFDSVEGTSGSEIVPVDVVPAALPIQFTVSPARIN